MIPLESDDPKIEAQYYKLHAEKYELALKHIVCMVAENFDQRSFEGDEFILESIRRELRYVRDGESIMNRIGAHFNK
jgi:hypothetical protein